MMDMRKMAEEMSTERLLDELVKLGTIMGEENFTTERFQRASKATAVIKDVIIERVMGIA